MILRISNVLAGERPLTPPERALKRVPFEAALLLIWLVITMIANIHQDGLRKMSFVPVIPAVLIGILIGFHYLRGVLFIRNFHHAITDGVHYEGCAVDSVKETIIGSPRGRSFYCRAWIQIEENRKIRTPVYKKFSSSYKYCDVYYYRKKYYFCAFRMRRER